MDDVTQREITNRLRRARGQIDGVIAMIEAGRPWRDVGTQLSAASKALDRAGYKLIATSLQECLVADSTDAESTDPRSADPRMTFEEVEKLFITLA